MDGRVWAKIFVLNTLASNFTPVGARYFEPLEAILPKLTKVRDCPDLSDADWLALGTLRVLHEVRSGRGFLQEVAVALPNCPDVSQFFATLRSKRRLEVCQEADALLAASLQSRLPDALAEVAELADFEVYAGDGHWHRAAAHDRRPFPGSPKLACGHFYALDLRRNLLRHLDVADQVEREHEHDMRALKRQTVEALRQGAGNRRKVLYVWDRAGIDFKQWNEWKRRGIYFLSREKENMALKFERALEWEQDDPRNAGVLSDHVCCASSGEKVRRISFLDPVSGQGYVFLTNEMTLPPGVIAELARRRWQIEKVFDELKNKLAETKAWGTTAEAKKMQAVLICITHQLLRALEHHLDSEDGVRPDQEIKRRAERIEQERAWTSKLGRVYPPLRAAATSLTQHTVKFLRWLRSSLRQSAPWRLLIDALRRSYASA